MPMASPVYAAGSSCDSRMPAQASGSTGRANNSKYSGRPQLAARRSCDSLFSANAMWNRCGMHTAPAKNTSSKTRAASPATGCSITAWAAGVAASQASRPAKPPKTSLTAIPIMSSRAASLTSDSKATAVTRPILRRCEFRFRVPKRMAKIMMITQNNSASMSWRCAAGITLSGAPASIWMLSATAWIWSASRGMSVRHMARVTAPPTR